MTLHIYRTEVSSDWIDYNQHMNAGYYNVVLDKAVEAILDELEGRNYLAETTGTFYSVETHIVYLRELKVGTPLRVETQLIGLDLKRLHVFSTIYDDAANDAAATGETMLVHVRQNVGKVIEMSPDFHGRLQAVYEAHSQWPRPENLGRAVRAVKGSRFA